MSPTKASLLRLIPVLALALVPLRAAEDPRLTALRAADDERVAAIISPDRARLTAILADDLRYAHSNGIVDTKASYTETLLSVPTTYATFDYEERNFTFPAPGIALMTGRVHTTGRNASGPADNLLSFLAVWREEAGKWRFLAWQSCKLAAPKPAAK
jgi:hypothetical protein